MARKGWRRDGKNAFITVNATIPKQLVISKRFEDGGYYLLVVGTLTDNRRLVEKKFKTKSQALKFAKKYMKSNGKKLKEVV